MEPLSLFVLALYGAYQASQRRKSSSGSSSSSYSHTPLSTTPKKTAVSQQEIKKASDTRMCQPEIKLSNNNKIKAE